jgi:uncharacterized protein YndB with AHSA1/START domain
MENLNLSTTITINAPAAKVWKALTDPSIVKQYFFGTNLKSDWKEGSPIVFEGEWEGKTYQDKGTILEIDPGRFVKYNYWSSMSGTEDKPENYAVISYELSGSDEETVLTITQDHIKTQESKEHSEQNWNMVFGKMKEMVESGIV